MKAVLKIKLGSKALEIHGEGTSEVIMKGLGFWSELPEACGNCGKTNISLWSRAGGKGTYYGLKCNGCRAELTFHQKKPENGGGFYLTPDDKWTIWQPKAGGQDSGGQANGDPDDDVAF